MSGYQESVTDPSFAGQLITFTYPHIGNYGVSSEAMESDRIHARAVIMREAVNTEDSPGAERGWLDWLTDCGVPGDQRRRHARAGPPHPRARARCAAGSSPAGTPEAAGARTCRTPSRRWSGRDLARRSRPDAVSRHGEGSPAR